mgnify:CR=1 FL=1
MDKIKQLENIAKVLGTYNVITKDEFNQVIKSVADVLKVERENIKGISEEYKQTLQSVINTISEEHDKVLQSVENTSQTAKSEATEAITKALEEVKRIAKEVMEMKPKDGERGLDADEEIIVEKVLGKIVLPEYKETVLDGGEQIVDKINALDLSPENQIDASHIKNLPEPKMIGGGSTARNLYQLGDVSISSPSNNQVLKYNATTRLWENGTGGGGGGVETIVQGNKIVVDATDPANPVVGLDTLTLNDISDVLATASEVNLLEGVTSNVQAQINTKANKSFAIAMAVAL